MENPEINGENGSPSISLPPRFIGQIILWAVIALVGWSFISTLQHETSIAVIEHRLNSLTVEVHILRGDHNDHRHNGQKSN